MLRNLLVRYQDLQQYVGWTEADTQRITDVAALVQPVFAELVEDFYREIQRHPPTAQVITGGDEQIARLKMTLVNWLRELFAGQYDHDYLVRRWHVGKRHVEIGLPQFFTIAALSRLRNGLIQAIEGGWHGNQHELTQTMQSINRLLDLDLAVIGDAYETEYVLQKQIVERRRLDDELHREREVAGGLLTHVQAAVLILDRDGKIVRSNPFADALLHSCLGNSSAEHDWFDVFLAEDERMEVRKALFPRDSDDSPTHIQASSILSQQGRQRQLQWTGASLHDPAGFAFGALMIGHEVTELVAAQQRALQVERLAAIGQMAAGLAHESRNALQRIGSTAELLELELAGNQSALSLIARIEQSNNHLHQLLEEVRSYAAPIVLDRFPLRITEIWREAWDLLLPQRRRRAVALQEEIVAEDLTVQADRFRLVQVFRNLLDNALTAAVDPARILIRCESGLLRDRPALVVRVQDNGTGMSEVQRRRIFEPFYTTKPTGTGLGTSIALRLVEAHGGTIHVGPNRLSAADNYRTEIVVTLPVK